MTEFPVTERPSEISGAPRNDTVAEFSVLGCGAWSPWFENWEGLVAAMSTGDLQEHASKGPAAAVIPGTERRRAPLPVKLAVEASMQACTTAGIDPQSLPSVFVSGLGDTQLTDYMCKALASDNKALSPTRFHNSVHNAAAGYWTISVGCEKASSSLAAFEESISMALLEAAIQLEAEQAPVLLTFYDAPVAAILEPLLKNTHAFALSMVLAPGTQFRLSTHSGDVEWPTLKLPGALSECYATNPAGRSLLLAQLLTQTEGGARLPLSTGMTMELAIQ
ncbi:MAG: beta-ketoacyl synthase chain length factor [Congregibacter sp.]